MADAQRLRPFARWWGDQVYRVSYFALCCRREQVIPTFKKLLRTTDFAAANQRELVNLVKDVDFDDCNGRTIRLPYRKHPASTSTYPVVVIWVRPDADVAVLTHECWHALYWVFTNRGVCFDEGMGADEPVAYYLTYLIRKALGTTV